MDDGCLSVTERFLADFRFQLGILSCFSMNHHSLSPDCNAGKCHTQLTMHRYQSLGLFAHTHYTLRSSALYHS